MFSDAQSDKFKELMKIFKKGGVINYDVYKLETDLNPKLQHQECALHFMKKYFKTESIEKYIKKENMFYDNVSDEMFSYIYPRFISPPYGLGSKKKEFEQLFVDINFELFGKKILVQNGVEYIEEDGKLVNNNVYDDLEIYCWMKDNEKRNWCPNFFNSGLDWWGSFFYTIKTKNENFVVIAGSASD